MTHYSFFGHNKLGNFHTFRWNGWSGKSFSTWSNI